MSQMGVWTFSDEPKESSCDWINRQNNGRLWGDASAKFSARSDGEDLRRTRLSLNRDGLAIVAKTDTKIPAFRLRARPVRFIALAMFATGVRAFECALSSLTSSF